MVFTATAVFVAHTAAWWVQRFI